jgi:hypothetical protein
MIDSNDDPAHQRPGSDYPPTSENSLSGAAPPSRYEQFWQQITSLGLADSTLRLATHVFSIIAVLIVVWVAREFYLAQPGAPSLSGAGVQAAEIPSPTPTSLPPTPPALPEQPVYARPGITRRVALHTTVPSRSRQEISLYTVQAGDTVFDIAEKFGIQAETVLWGNYHILADDPHRLQAGQELTILPVDGTYYEWQPGDGLNGVARFFGVTPEAIINWQGNNLDPAALGDLSAPNIEPGTWLVIPGGRREFVTWSAPRITRADPGVAKVLGPGFCGPIADGPLGAGSFIWPANNRFLSGYDYAPSANHYGIDIDGDLGDPVYAADSGVVVYAGWNDWGYGNMVVIDHGNGWQTLYAHLDTFSVGCGSYANQGGVLGSFGSTGNSSGPHLHFELMSDQYGKVNPWDFIQ